MEFYQPRAAREGASLRKRILQEQAKVIEKYKLAMEERMELYDSARTKKSVSGDFEKPMFETTALYYKDVEDDDRSGEDSDESRSHKSLQFKNAFLNRCCSKIIGTRKRVRLTWTQIMCFTFFLQVPLVCIVHHISIVQQWGGIMVLVIYSVVGFAICVPVHMVYLFAGFFTRRSYIKFWDSVPILRGVGFSVGLIFMYQELYNVIFAAIAFRYVAWMVREKVPWYGCEFEGASAACAPDNNNSAEAFMERCCTVARGGDPQVFCNRTEQVLAAFKYAAFEYYARNVLFLDDAGRTTRDGCGYALNAILVVMWVLIFVLVLFGLARTARAMAVVNVAMFVLLVPVVAMAFALSPRYSVVPDLKSDFGKHFGNYEFWIYTGLNIIHRELPCDVIAFAATSRVGVSVTVDTTIIYLMKFFFTAVFTVWTSVGVSYEMAYYNIANSECLITDGDVLIFALFPDIVSRLPAPQLWLIVYFLFITLWGLSTAFYVYIAFVEAVLEQFKDFSRWRLLICVVICFTAGSTSVILFSPDTMNLLKEQELERIAQMKSFMLCISFIGLYFYSITTFRQDYHFYTGEILGDYWIVWLKVSILLVLISTGLNIVNFFDSKIDKYGLLVCLIPVVIGVTLASVRYALKIIKSLISPSPNWGPISRNQKLARIKFDPSHDLHYRSVVQRCPHNCLLYSNSLKKEVQTLLTKKYNAEANME